MSGLCSCRYLGWSQSRLHPAASNVRIVGDLLDLGGIDSSGYLSNGGVCCPRRPASTSPEKTTATHPIGKCPERGYRSAVGPWSCLASWVRWLLASAKFVIQLPAKASQ